MKIRSALVTTALLTVVALPLATADASQKKPPRTGFENSDGAEWTTHEDEVKFLRAVDQASDRVVVDVIGQTAQKRPLHLVQIGAPRPASAAAARQRPTIFYICTQHGNEPAGREACLQLLRDLAFTKDAQLVSQLERQTILFVPTANPDGRAANTRGNSAGVDINRDHLNLETPEAQALASVVRDWRPDIVIDLHEYGPAIPVTYDDEVLLLWPRNLNVDDKVHDLAQALVLEDLTTAAEENGYSADEYGQQEVGDQDVQQTAGDHDEGIARNAFGLRHGLGVLVETRVDQDLRNGPQEVQQNEVNKRRVAAHYVVAVAALEYLRARGSEVAGVTAGAFVRKSIEGKKRNAPVYFGGADNQEPTPEQIQDPPPCGYRLSARQAKGLARTLDLLAIRGVARGSKVYIPMGQPAEPLIPLLLDARGPRHAVEGKPVMKC